MVRSIKKQHDERHHRSNAAGTLQGAPHVRVSRSITMRRQNFAIKAICLLSWEKSAVHRVVSTDVGGRFSRALASPFGQKKKGEKRSAM